MQGALVDCKATDVDWPKEHKYDRLDFTYDVPADKLEAEKGKYFEENIYFGKNCFRGSKS